MNKFTEEIKSFILNRIDEFEGDSICGCDLSFKLTERENIDCSVLYSTSETKEFLKENFDLVGDFVAYAELELDTLLNPFKEPEKAHVWLLIESVNFILSRCELINESWNDEIELTADVIAQIKKEVTEVSEDITF